MQNRNVWSLLGSQAQDSYHAGRSLRITAPYCAMTGCSKNCGKVSSASRRCAVCRGKLTDILPPEQPASRIVFVVVEKSLNILFCIHRSRCAVCSGKLHDILPPEQLMR
jgi:hypothetical protein